MTHKLLAGLVLITVLTAFSTCGYILHLRNQRDDALAVNVLKDLELEGAHKALLVKPKEIVKFVEVPAAIKAAVKSGAVTPLAAVKGTAKSNVVNIPCPPATADAAVPPSTDEPEADSTKVTSTAPVWFEIKGNLFIGQIRHGEAMWTGTVDGHIHSGEFQAPIDFEPENIDFQVKVSDEIGKALDYSNRSWIRKHFGVACPGASVTYNPLNARPVDVALTCGVAMVWHPW